MNPDGVARFSVSLNQALLRQLDGMIAEKGYTNRSLAIADIIRYQLVDHQQERAKTEAAGTITLIYDHYKAHVQETLTELQHQFRGLVISSLHVHLDHDNCLEVLVVRERAPAIRSLADQLIAAKGVKHGRLSITTAGLDIPVYTGRGRRRLQGVTILYFVTPLKPSSLFRLALGALSLHDVGPFFANARARYFGPRALTQDGRENSSDTFILFAEAGYCRTPTIATLITTTSRLRGEPTAGVDDTHTHPVEPREIRFRLTARF